MAPEGVTGGIRKPDPNQSDADADLDLTLSLSVGHSTVPKRMVRETGTHIAKVRNTEPVHNLNSCTGVKRSTVVGSGATAFRPYHHAKVKKEEVLGSAGLSEESRSVKGSVTNTKHAGTLLELYKLTPHLSIPCFLCCAKADSTNTESNMPCVTVRDSGPGIQTIEGVIYQVSISGDVIIICNCHRLWLSPREFVEHAGLTNVENPLRQIIVVPPP